MRDGDAQILSIDLETYSTLDIKKVGGYKYAENSEILLFGYAFDDEPVHVIDMAGGEVLPPEVRRAIFDKNILKTAYNAPFERAVLSFYFSAENYMDGDPTPITLEPEGWLCTMVQAYTLGLPGGLDNVSKVLRLSEDKAKLSAGKQLIQYFCKPCKPTKTNGLRTRNLPEHAPEKWALFKEYCGRDVEAERTIRKMMQKFMPNEFERKIWFLDQQINDRGVKIAATLVKNAIQADKIFKTETMAQAKELSGLENPNSRDQMLAWFEDQEGYQLEKLDKEAIAGLLQSLENDKVKKMLQLKQLLSKTSVKKYETMQRACCHDGRIHGALQFYGAARTGRWAGRLVQLHNLPRNAMDDLDTARTLLRSGEFEVFEFFYENVPDTLSQLIRTAFIAEEGSRFIVADFSAIEARVIAWLAGEKWRLDVFAGDGKIYEASAAQMFHVPVETIDKHSPLRQKGKVAELACGYQGGPGALIKMGALKGGLTEEELPGIIQRWRKASPRIVKMWWDIEKCAIDAVKNKTRVNYRYGIQFAYESGMLFIRLPSGRRLAYIRPRLEPEPKFNKIGLTYEGAGQETGRKGAGGWMRHRTYGGKLVENCLSEATKVLTGRGWVRISKLQTSDLLWDGLEWVSHQGIVSKGIQQTISLDGVRMTPDHMVLTKEEGWKCASSCEGYHRAEIKCSYSNRFRRSRRKEVPLENKMRLRKRVYNARNRVQQRNTEILRLSEKAENRRAQPDAWYVQSSGLWGMAVHDRSLQGAVTSSLEKLWRERRPRMRKMGKKFCGILGRYGSELQARFDFGAGRRERRLYPGELSMGESERPSKKQKEQYAYADTLGQDYSSGSRRKIRHRRNNATLSNQSRLAAGRFLLTAGFYESVWDVVNAGPRNRFVVKGQSGPFIVHNCVQAIARDCLAASMLWLDEAGYKIIMHVHDEVICEMPDGQGSVDDACKIMGRPIDWAKGLILRAEGYETKYYKKD